MSFLGHYLVLLLIFVVIDFAWLAVVAKKFYQKELGSLLRKKAKKLPAVLFYLLYIWGIIYFVLDPGLAAKDISVIIKHAVLLGLIMYATYDLTNLSTLKNWSTKLTLVDLIWGVLLTTVVSTLGYAIFR